MCVIFLTSFSSVHIRSFCHILTQRSELFSLFSQLYGLLQRSHFRQLSDRVSSVYIATRYGLGGPGVEFRWDEIFRIHPDLPCRPPNLLCDVQRVSFARLKYPGRGVDHPLPSSDEVKERVQPYFYSFSGSLWPVLG